MIPIKIQCGCGQKYAFDVESANRGMSCHVQCPACGADGTPAANLAISRHFASPPKRSGAPVANRWVVPALGGTVGVALLCLAALCIGRTHAQSSKPTGNQVVVTFPRTLPEINAWYAEPPAGQNAATVFAQGFAALQIRQSKSGPASTIRKRDFAAARCRAFFEHKIRHDRSRARQPGRVAILRPRLPA